MKKSLTLLVGIALLVVLLVYMFTFTVRYDEVAVLTTFDKATESSLKQEPGLYIKAPAPIQQVYTYTKRLKVLEDRAQEVPLQDGSTVIVKLYLAWRVDDPYAYFRSLKDDAQATAALETLLRNLTGVISQYRFDQLVNTDAQALKLQEIESRMLEQMREQLAQIRPGYGIAVEQVGISRVILPEATTEKVFERMRKTRERMAEAARAEGRSQAATITSRAESAQKRILAFAERRAQAIRDEGNREANQFFATFAEDQDFAVFIRNMESLKESLAKNTTFILDANKLWWLSPLAQQPEQAQGAGGSQQAQRGE